MALLNNSVVIRPVQMEAFERELFVGCFRSHIFPERNYVTQIFHETFVIAHMFKKLAVLWKT
jgi:hypothetical protein